MERDKGLVDKSQSETFALLSEMLFAQLNGNVRSNSYVLDHSKNLQLVGLIRSRSQSACLVYICYLLIFHQRKKRNPK